MLVELLLDVFEVLDNVMRMPGSSCVQLGALFGDNVVLQLTMHNYYPEVQL